MSVDVQTGDVLIFGTQAAYPAWSDAVSNVVITAADPTNPRRDIIVAYINLSVTTTSPANNQGGLEFKAVAGTPAGSPSDPSDSTIQSSVGAGRPWIKLARVAVAASASSIVNANITDLRTPAALAVPYLYGGASNTNGHLVPNAADDTVTLNNAVQTLTNKTFTSPTINSPVIGGTAYADYLSGWTAGSGTWTYASSTTMTVPSADAAAMSTGTRIKLTQTTAKYFYVTGISGTTVTLNGGTDYTLANAAITSPLYSNTGVPTGFPQTFAYTPILTGSTGSPTLGNSTLTGRFGFADRFVNYRLRLDIGSTFSVGSGAYRFSLPVAAHANHALNSSFLGSGTIFDSSAGETGIITATKLITTTTFEILGGKASAFGGVNNGFPFAWATGDFIDVNVIYEAA